MTLEILEALVLLCSIRDIALTPGRKNVGRYWILQEILLSFTWVSMTPTLAIGRTTVIFFVKDYLNLIDTFRKANPSTRIIMARMTPIADRHAHFLSGTHDWHGEIQTAIETVASCVGVLLIDFHEPLYPYPYLLLDAVHPTAEGAAIIAKTVYSAITGDYGGLKLPSLYTDNMVLQCDTPLLIHGSADAGEQVTVRIGSQQRVVKTTPDGKWSVKLLPLKAGGPYTLAVSTPRRTLKYVNVLAGRSGYAPVNRIWSLCCGKALPERKIFLALLTSNSVCMT